MTGKPMHPRLRKALDLAAWAVLIAFMIGIMIGTFWIGAFIGDGGGVPP